MLYANVGMAPDIEEKLTEGRLDAGEGRSLTYRLSYPAVNGHRDISACYSSAAGRYERAIRSRYRAPLYALPAGSYEISGSFQVTYCGGRLLSIYQDTYENIGPYKRSLMRTAATWDLFRGKKVGIGDLFVKPYELTVRVSRLIDREISALNLDSPGSYYWLFGPARWGWHLTERGLAVFFQPEIIAPANGGIPTFLLPQSEIRDIARFEI